MASGTFVEALLTAESALIIVLHPLLYYVFFSTAARIWNGASTVTVAGNYHMEKLNEKVASASLVARERRRTLTSAVVDGVWGVWMLWMCRQRLAASPATGAAWWFGASDGVIAAILRHAFHGIVYVYWMELHFYATHRLLHVGPLFKYVHYAHHESYNPGPWSSCSFHPVEAAIFFSGYLAYLFLDFSPFLLAAIKVSTVAGTLHGHIGYSPAEGSGDYYGHEFHFLHHTHKDCNYGAYPTGLIDRLMGTERLPRRARFCGGGKKGD